MNDKKMPTEQERIVLAECKVVFTELKLTHQLLLNRMSVMEKEVKRLKYIIISAIIALQAILPKGLISILDLFNKVP
jgi:hypothetical protein